MKPVVASKPEEKKSHEARSAEPVATAAGPIGSFGATAGMPLFLQTKLVIDAPGDAYEREADDVATEVTSRAQRSPWAAPPRVSRISAVPAPSSGARVQRMCAGCASGGAKCSHCEDEEEHVQRKALAGGASYKRDTQWDLPPPGGEAHSETSELPPHVREAIEAVVGADLGDVRVHTGPAAWRSTRAIGARAFTHGRHIWLGQHESAHDVALMAHESTHVVQQTGGRLLPAPVASRLSSAYGRDVSGVRIHVDSDVPGHHGKDAVAVRDRIDFAPGAYCPGTRAGDTLIAHEVAHVVQQRGGSAPAGHSPPRARSYNALEGEARRAASVATRGGTARALSPAPAGAPQGGALDVVTDIGHGIASGADYVGGGISHAASSVYHGAGDVVNAGVDLAEGAAEQVGEAVADQFWNVVREIYAPAEEYLRNPSKLWQLIVDNVMDGISSMLGGLFSAFGTDGIFGSLAGLFKRITSAAVDLASQVTGKSCGSLAAALEKGATALLEITDAILDPIQDAVASVWKVISPVVKFVFNGIVDILKTIGGAYWETLKTLVKFIGKIWSEAKKIAGAVWDWVKDLLGLGGDDASEDGAWGWIKRKATEVWDGVKTKLLGWVEPLKVVGGILLAFSPVGPLYIAFKYGPRVVHWIREVWKVVSDPNTFITMKAYVTDTLLPGVMAFALEVAGVFDGIAASIAASLQSVSKPLADLAASFDATKVLTIVADGVRAFATMVSNAVKWVSTNIGPFFQKIGGFFRGLWAWAKPILDVMIKIVSLANPVGILMLIGSQVWLHLSSCIKKPIVRFILDFLIRIVRAMPDVMAAFGPLWTFVKFGVLGFLDRVRGQQNDPDEAISAIDRICRLVGGTAEFALGMVVGILEGMWDGLIGPFQLIWMLVEAVVGIMDFFEQVQNKFEEKMRSLIGSAKGMVQSIKANFWPTIEGLLSGKGGSGGAFDTVMGILGQVWDAVTGAAASVGGAVAGALIAFIMLGDYALGSKLGYVAGLVLFEVILAILTAGVTAELKFFESALGKVLKLLVKINEYIGEIFGAILKVIPGLEGAITRAIEKIGEMPGLKTLIGEFKRMFGQVEELALAGLRRFGGEAAGEGVGVGARLFGKAETETAGALATTDARTAGATARADETAANATAKADEAGGGAAGRAESQEASVADSSHLESGALTQKQIDEELAHLGDNPQLVTGEPPARRAKLGEHEWVEQPNGGWCRHSNGDRCVLHPPTSLKPPTVRDRLKSLHLEFRDAIVEDASLSKKILELDQRALKGPIPEEELAALRAELEEAQLKLAKGETGFATVDNTTGAQRGAEVRQPGTEIPAEGSAPTAETTGAERKARARAEEGREFGEKGFVDKHHHDIGVANGTARAEADGLVREPWVNPRAGRGGYGQGFDDIMRDKAGNLVIIEFKGGAAELAKGQMSRAWVESRIEQIAEANPTLAAELRTALNNGTLTGRVYRTPIFDGNPLPTIMDPVIKFPGVTPPVPAVQPKSIVNTPGDVYEREADAVADAAASHNNRASVTAAPSTEAPLPAHVRASVEPVLGANLGDVRVHSGPDAARSAHSLQARAFTHGRDIWLGAGESAHDVRLMAHESTHVVQQTGGKPTAPVQRDPTTSTTEKSSYTPAATPTLVDVLANPPVTQYSVSTSGITFHMTARKLAVGSTDKQLMAIVLRALLGDNYTPKLIDPMLDMTRRAKAVKTGLWIGPQPAAEKPKGDNAAPADHLPDIFLDARISITMLIGLKNVLKLHTTTTPEQEDVLLVGLVASIAWAEMLELHLGPGEWLPSWYNKFLFDRQAATHADDFQAYGEGLDLVHGTKRGKNKEADDWRRTQLEVIADKLTDEAAPVDSIRTDTSLCDVPKTLKGTELNEAIDAAAMYHVLWDTPKDKVPSSPPTKANDAMTIAAFLVWSFGQPTLAKRAEEESDRDARVQLLVRFATYLGFAQKSSSADELLRASPTAATALPFPSAMTAYPPLVAPLFQVPLDTERRFEHRLMFKTVYEAFSFYHFHWQVVPVRYSPKFDDDKPVPAPATPAAKPAAPPTTAGGQALQKPASQWDEKQVASQIDAQMKDMAGLAKLKGHAASNMDRLRVRYARAVQYHKEDIETVFRELGPAGAGAADLATLNAILRYAGAGLGVLKDWLFPNNKGTWSDKKIAFPESGIYIVRCAGSPFIAGEETIVRAPSVAYQPVFVRPADEIAAAAVYETESRASDERAMKADLDKVLKDDEQETDPAKKLSDDDRKMLMSLQQDVVAADQGVKANLTLELKRLEESIAEHEKDPNSNAANLSDELAERDRLKELLHIQEKRKLTDAKPMHATFVSDGGETIPLDLEESDKPNKDGTWNATVSDLTTIRSGTDDANGKTKNEAIEHATKKTLESIHGYGRGIVAIEFDGKIISVRIAADVGQIGMEGIENLTTILTIAAIAAAPFTGGATLTLLLPIGAVGAIPSVYRLVERNRVGTLRWDLETAMDLVNIVGSVAGLAEFGMASRAAGLAAKGLRPGVWALRVGKGVLVINHAANLSGIVLLGGGIIAQLEALKGLPEGEARDRRFEIIGGALLQAGIMVGGSLAAEHAKAQQERLAAAREVVDRIPSDVGTVQNARTMAGAGEGGASTKGSTPPTAGDKPKVDPLEHQLASGEKTPAAKLDPLHADKTTIPDRFTWEENIKDPARALARYNEARARASGREVGVWRNTKDGTYAVTVGSPHEVHPPSGSNWEGVLHYHPNPTNTTRFELPAPADFNQLIERYQAGDGKVAVREFVDAGMADGRQTRTEFGIDPAEDLPFYVTREINGEKTTMRFKDDGTYRQEWHGETVYVDEGTAKAMKSEVDTWLANLRAERAKSDPSHPDIDVKPAPETSRTMAGTADGPKKSTAKTEPKPAASAAPKASDEAAAVRAIRKEYAPEIKKLPADAEQRIKQLEKDATAAAKSGDTAELERVRRDTADLKDGLERMRIRGESESAGTGASTDDRVAGDEDAREKLTVLRGPLVKERGPRLTKKYIREHTPSQIKKGTAGMTKETIDVDLTMLGRAANKKYGERSPYAEVPLVTPVEGQIVYLDNYGNGEIISRKRRGLDYAHDPLQGVEDVRELALKYREGMVIRNTKGTRAAGIYAKPGDPPVSLVGQPILEIRPQQSALPAAMIEMANRHGIVIRDFEGKIYNPP